MIPNIGICTFEWVISFPRLYKFALAEMVLYQSDHLGFLDMSAGNVLGSGAWYQGLFFFFGQGHCLISQVGAALLAEDS